jgi:hypothetical protein
MSEYLCMLMIATALQTRGESPLSNPNNERRPERSCRQGADATVVFWQEIERGGRPVDRRSIVCTPPVVAKPVAEAGAGVGE